MGAAFTQPLDIWNRACDHCGVTRIVTVGEDTKQATLAAAIYDKVRQSELRRNLWRFSVRRNVTRPITSGTTLVTPPAWSAGTYTLGKIVTSGGDWWQCAVASTAATPASSGTDWKIYFGNDSAEPWDYTGNTSYFAGELVVVPATYSAGTTYGLGEIVRDTDLIFYVSLQNSNTGHTPAISTTFWQPYQAWLAVTPNSLATPLYTNTPAVWMSMGNGNLTSPITLGAPDWLDISATVANLHILYPIQTGPASDTQTANVYRLPRGYLRRAPENPKAGVFQFLGGPSALPLRDDLYEGNYLIAPSENANTARLVRFGADMAFVLEMDPMFCEGIAARLALEMNYPLNQNDGRESMIAKEYALIMKEARGVNAIEQGPEFPAEDPWITARA